jgi:hypothetical protein
VDSLSTAGHLLIAGLTMYDGTNYAAMFMAYDAKSNHWRVIWSVDCSTVQPSVLGALLVNTSYPPQPNTKYLLLSYGWNANSYVVSLHMPRGFVGASGIDDEFALVASTSIPEAIMLLPPFTGGDMGRNKTLVEIVAEVELFEANANHKIELRGRANTASLAEILQIDGSEVEGTGRRIKKYQPSGGISFRSYDLMIWGFVNTDEYFPYLHSLEYAWRPQGDTRLGWEIMIDTQKWMRDNTKVVSDLLTRLSYSRDRGWLPQAAITNIMTAARVTLSEFKLENPSDPSSAPIGLTLVRLEEPI